MELTELLTSLKGTGGVRNLVRSGREAMRRFFSWQFSVLLLAGMAAGAQVNNSNQNGKSPDGPPAENATPPAASQAPTTQPMITPGVTVTGTPPRAEPPLPKLPPDQFIDCYAKYGGREAIDSMGLFICEIELTRDQRTVFD